MTTETFAAWKKNRIEKKAAEAEAMEKAKVAQRAAGKMTGMTGKDMFEFGGELYDDADEGEDEDWDISRMLARYVSRISCPGCLGGAHAVSEKRKVDPRDTTSHQIRGTGARTRAQTVESTRRPRVSTTSPLRTRHKWRSNALSTSLHILSIQYHCHA